MCDNKLQSEINHAMQETILEFQKELISYFETGGKLLLEFRNLRNRVEELENTVANMHASHVKLMH